MIRENGERSQTKPGVCSGLMLSGAFCPRPEGRGLSAAEVSMV